MLKQVAVLLVRGAEQMDMKEQVEAAKFKLLSEILIVSCKVLATT